MQLTTKQKIFYQFFTAFIKFQIFWEKDVPHRFFISEIMDSENVVR